MTVSVLLLTVEFIDISDIIYFVEFSETNGKPLKYQMMFGIGEPVVWQINKALSPSFTVWFATSTSITGVPSVAI